MEKFSIFFILTLLVSSAMPSCVEECKSKCGSAEVQTSSGRSWLPYILGGAAVGLLFPPALAAVGFTSAGVGAGTVAATVHSYIGSVGAGSLFAFFQSYGATTAAVSLTSMTAGAAVGGVAKTGMDVVSSGCECTCNGAQN